MSADLYLSELSEEVYGSLSLYMPVHGHLRCVINSPEEVQESSCFTLPPNPDGWKEAEALISALQEWVRHTKEDL